MVNPDDLDAVAGVAGIDGERISPSEIKSKYINKVLWLDPDAADFGRAVNDAVGTMNDGDVLRIPPASYSTQTTATFNKNISIIGSGEGVGSHYHYPEITKDDNIPIFDIGGSDNSIWLVGMKLNGYKEGTDTTPAILAHSRVKIDRVTGDWHGDALIKLSSSPAPNHNHSRITNVGSSVLDGGSVVEVASDSYGIDIHVRMSSKAEYAVDIANEKANGIRAWLQSCFNNDIGAIRLNGTGCHAYVQKAQSTPKGVVFDNTGNLGELVEFSGGTSFVDNTAKPRLNRKIDHGIGQHIPGALTSESSVTVEADANISIAPGSYSTVFDVSEATEIISGSLVGQNIGWRLTIDGTVVVDDRATGAGGVQAGRGYSVVNLPPARSRSSMKLECLNQSRSTIRCGWRVFRRKR